MADGPKKEKVVDSPAVETVFVDGIHGMEFRDGVAVLNLTRHVFPAPNSNLDEPFNLVVQRLAMPITAFARFADWFADSKQEMLDRGVVVPVEKQEDDTDG